MGTKYMYHHTLRLTVIKQFKAYTASIIKSDAIMDAEGTLEWSHDVPDDVVEVVDEPTLSSSTEGSTSSCRPASLFFWRAQETRVPL